MIIRKAVLAALFINGAAAFAPAKQLAQIKSNSIVSTRLRSAVEKEEAVTDAPDHMPELREIAPTFDAKTSNTAFERYKSEYARSISHNADYWGERAKDLLTWDKTWDSVITGGFEHGDVAWFSGGKLNVCYNAIDRHVQNGKADQVAMVSMMVRL
jgi:hypothetical protein